MDIIGQIVYVLVWILFAVCYGCWALTGICVLRDSLRRKHSRGHPATFVVLEVRI